LLSGAGRGKLLGRGMTRALFVLAPLFGVWETFAEEDRSEDYRGRKIIETVAAEAERGSTVLHHRGAVWYLLLVEERRQDLIIADPWYPSWTRYQDIVWPRDAGLSTEHLERGEGGRRSGVTLATEALAETGGPVYLIDQPALNAANFYQAGYGFEVVEEGILYRLVPPGG
ncbi:MAG TPA: membrane protein, partial [Rubrobacteraceae bacterium]|nr:membrane protein [Rubrobacteraceae bacterium]